ncbi:MAG TPA: membrane protein insertase YidC [Xylella sp.]
MNQTRVFLIFSWLVVSTLLWIEWGKNNNTLLEFSSYNNVGVHNSSDYGLPQINTSAASTPQKSNFITGTTGVPVINVTTDVLQLKLDGFSILSANLLKFPESKDNITQPVKLLTDNTAYPYVATSGWVSQSNSLVPSAITFAPEKQELSYTMDRDQSRLVVPYVWTATNGVTIHRTFSFERGRYAILIKDEVYNGSSMPWSAYVFRRLARVPNILSRSMTNPDSFSFNGAVWYSEETGYERRPFKDYMDDGGLNRKIIGGWIALLQHHFFTAWIPQKDQASLYLLAQDGPGDIAELRGPAFSLAPGQSITTEARLWVGPKLVDQIAKEQIKGLDRVVDYSRFQLMAVIGQGLFWILSHLNNLFHNWGWAIVGLVVLLRLVMYPLSAAQYKSAAKMRKFQPRLQQLKERYGEDRQKFQQAMMELYKKEKINPMGGCLPILIQMPIFFALYWVLVESVELRQAPWLGWIQDLTTRDPYFILPILNIAIMWATQKLTPTPAGMDPMSQRMMKLMPLIFGGMMAFVPAGLALYWVINGGLNLLIQWWMIRQHSYSSQGKLG